MAHRPLRLRGARVSRALLLSSTLLSAAAVPACSPHDDLDDVDDYGELGAARAPLTTHKPLLANPEIPSVLRDVAIHREGAPVTPTFRNKISSSNDGRILIAGSQLMLLAPERVEGSFWDQPGGEPMQRNAVTFSGAMHAQSGGRAGGSAICEATRQFDGGGAKQPYACDEDDCYDLTVVTPVMDTAGMTLWGAPIRVRVTKPKTKDARITSVTSRGPVVRGAHIAGVKNLFEPQITADGRLLIGRVAGSVRDPETRDRLNIVYAALPASASPCDVKGWTELRAISRAPYDNAVRTKYGFAKAPFRDTEGAPIPPGKDLGATYPWIDREGKNLFVKTGSRTLYFTAKDGTIQSTFPARCATSACTSDSPDDGMKAETPRSPNGIAALGAWTHGKMVLLDGRLNPGDFGLGVRDQYHREIHLYRGANGWVRVGSSRVHEELPDSGGNTGHIQSPEHLFNFRASLRPRTPRDVVWIMSTQLTADEVVFDDWIDPHALIVSDMMPSWSFDDGSGSEAYRDGYEAGVGFGGTAPIRMQNAATAPKETLATPSYGQVHGRARAEPVALGGVFGRGFWLTGNNGISYAIPRQPRTLDDVWYTSIFVDARVPDDAIERRLLSFPDGSTAVFVGRKTLALRGRGGMERATIDLKGLALDGRSYRHFGFRKVGSKLDVLVDGYVYAQANIHASFAFPAGNFVVGQLPDDTIEGMRGWVDELRVFNEPVGAELACNHARGSLVGLAPSAPTAFRSLANLYPSSSHAAVSRELQEQQQPTFGSYACRHDYTRDTTSISFEVTPPGVTSVRASLLTPKPLVFGSVRPDNSTNAFCKTCHTAEQTGPLALDALSTGARLMQNDRRREPMLPPRLMFGWVPPGVVGPGLPAAATNEADGYLLDRLVFRR